MFQAGIDEGGFEIPGTGRPFGRSARIKSTQGTSEADPL
jgi:hypothetical protein